MTNSLVNTYGEKIEIKNCVIGRNLNLVQVRGFIPLSLAADISGPDVFDEKLNPLGTQRDLKPTHAAEASKYALTSLGVSPDSDPRSFPEIILNVRSMDAVQIILDGEVLEFISLEDWDMDARVVDVIVNLDAVNYPHENFNPSISRMDGNHRLSRVPSIEDRDDSERFPDISFAMFVGLSKNQERKLFADINGKQQKVDVSYLSQISMELEGDQLLLNATTRPLWFAKRLIGSGEVFENIVFQGGAKKGVQEQLGYVPPLNLATLRSMIAETLRGLDAVVVHQLPPDLIHRAARDRSAMKELVDNGEAIKVLLTRFWLSVKENFQEAWQDPKKVNFILYQSVGALALSMLAPVVINELIEKGTISQEEFNKSLSHLRNGGITLAKGDYQGLAGVAGAKKVYEALLEAKLKGGSGISAVIKDLKDAPVSKLD